MDTRDDTVLPGLEAPPDGADPDLGAGALTGDDQPPGTLPPPPDAPKPRRHRLRLALLIVAGLLLVALVASLFIPLPYYLVAPGSARATEPLVSVEGGPEYPPEHGAIYFTTVSTRPARALTALLGWLDPDTDVVDEDVILGTNTPAQNRQVNLQMMSNSVDVAAEVAFEHLGFDVESGTGATITGVAPDMPVADVVRPGDVIVAVDGHPTTTADEAVTLIQAHDPGDEVRLRLENDPSLVASDDHEGDAGEGSDQGNDPGGAPDHANSSNQAGQGSGSAGSADQGSGDHLDRRTVTVELGSRPDDADKPLLGVQLGTRDQVLDLPYPVEIDTGKVGGPSAGLAFTLAVLDVLTPGELTGGKQVAVTGTIDGLGNVGPIGGIEQKAAAVRDAGADVFIVPASEAADARERAGDVPVVGVETLDDALHALDELGGNALDLQAPDVEQSTDG